MAVEETVTRNPPEEVTGTTGEIRITEDAERDLLAGAADIAADENEGDFEAMDDLQDRLMGYQLNSEREVAWIRRFVMPDADVAEAEIAEEEVGVEFLLPSGNTFWRTYDLPDRRWPDANEFVRLLDHLGAAPSTLDTVTGERVDITYDETRGKWRVVGLEVDEEGVPETDHTEQWNRREEMRVLEDDSDGLYSIAACAALATTLVIFAWISVTSGLSFDALWAALVSGMMVGVGIAGIGEAIHGEK